MKRWVWVMGWMACLSWAQGQTQLEWIDGVFSQSQGLSCVYNTPQVMVMANAGYQGTRDTSFPRTGDISYVHGVAGLVGTPCAADVVGFELLAPDGSEPAVSAAQPVRCFLINIETNERTEMTYSTEEGYACLQTPETGQYGLFYGYGTIATGYIYEVQVPLRFNKELNGIFGPLDDQLLFAVSSVYGFLAPKAGVIVPYQARVEYPANPIENLSATGARVKGTVGHFRKAAQVFVDYGPSTAYGTSVGPVNLAASSSTAEISAELTALTPATRYHWRLRATVEGISYSGSDQTFTTLAGTSPPPAPPPPNPPPGPPPPPSGTAVSRLALPNQGIKPGDFEVPALRFKLETNQPSTLSQLGLEAVGSGHDAQDIAQVALYRDDNSNGQIDSGEPMLASGVFTDDNGLLNLVPTTAQSLSGSTSFLIVVDFAQGFALTSVLLTVLIGSLAATRSRPIVWLLVLLLVACSQTPNKRTYQLELNTLSLKNTSGQTVSATGLPIKGAELSNP